VSAVTIFSVAIFSTSDKIFPSICWVEKTMEQKNGEKMEKAFCKWYVIVSK
jgi:hypothetical protein